MISKKVQKTDKGQSLRAYVYSVVAYISNPDSEPNPETGEINKGEKCVAVQTNCLYDNDVKGMVNEMVDCVHGQDMESGSQPIVHRIISFPEGERPTEQQCFDMAHSLMRDLGYDESHQYVIAVHNDTDNLHMHIVSNRYSTIDGKLLEEGKGWDELECRRACVRCEKQYGLQPEPGSRFIATNATETVPHTNPFTGEVSERQRPCIEQVRKSKVVPEVRDRARWAELKTGLKSQQRVMQEIFAEVRPQLNNKLNFGQFYKLMAENGVQCELVKHGKNHYLTYSIDGQNWEKPSDIHRDFSSQELEKILGSTVRKPKDKLTEIAEEARKVDEVHMTDETTKKMTYSKEQIAALRTIPVDEVRQAFDLPPDTNNKKVRNAVDVLVHQNGMQYADAVQTLAERYPGVVSGDALVNTIDTDTIKRRLDLAGVPDTLKRTGADVLRQLDAFGAERFHIYGNAPDRNFTSASNTPDGWSKEEVLRNLPFLAKMNMDGGHIYIDPQYGDSKIKIPVDDVQQGFIDNYRPSMALNTSREKQQAHYVIDRKYEKEFYDVLTENINARWGDPKIRTADHDSRLAGFSNRKPAYEDENGKYPFVKVQQSTPIRCHEFEKYVDEQYVLYKQGKLKPLSREKDISRLSTQTERDNAMQQMQERTVPPYLTNQAIAHQSKIRQQYGQQLDRSKADYMTADYLYRLGATPEQTYSFLRHNALQDDELVARRHTDGSEYKVRKNVSQAHQERHARRTAINAYFEKGHAAQAQQPPAPLPDLTQAVQDAGHMAPSNRWEREQQAAVSVPTAPRPAPRVQTRNAEQAMQEQREHAEQEAKAKAAAKAKAVEEQRQHQIREQREREEAREARQKKLNAARVAAAKVKPYTPPRASGGHNQGGSPSSGPRM